MLFGADTYKEDGKYVIPDRDDEKITKEEKRTKKYCLAVIEGMYSEFIRGRVYWPTDYWSNVDRNRAYALGRQDVSKYMDLFYGKAKDGIISPSDDDPNSRRRAYNNINFDVQSPAPKIMDKLVGQLSEATDIVSVDPTDRYSGAQKESMKWGAFVDGKYRKMFAFLNSMAGLPQQDIGYVPENVEELNLHEAEGGFKQNYAILMERLLKYTFEQSRWGENTLDRVITDLCTFGFACVEDVYDHDSAKVYVEYRDPLYAGVQYTREDSYNKPDYGFAIVPMKISELRRKGIYDEETLEGLAVKYSGHYGNPTNDDWNKENKRSVRGYTFGYDPYIVPVMRASWIDVEYDYEVKHTNKYGKTKTWPYKEGSNLGPKDKKIGTRIKMLYSCAWVVDSEIILPGYGPTRHQARDGMSDPVVPFHAVKVINRPIIDRLIPALDQYFMSWLRFQQGISMAAPSGFSIDVGSLSNLSLGNKKMNPLEVLKMWRQTGILFRKDATVQGIINPSSTNPIIPIAGGAGAIMQESMLAMEASLKMIEEQTGFNPISMGANPNPETGKAVTEYSIAGTNDILKNVVKQVNILKSDAARAICLRLQYVVSDSKRARKGYSDIVSDTDLELLKIAEGNDVKYGIRTHVRPTQQEIKDIYTSIELSLKNGRDGKVGITDADVVRFKAMIQSGASLKRVAQLLSFANKKAQEQAEERLMRKTQVDAQTAKAAQDGKLQADLASENAKTQGTIASNNSKSVGDLIVKAYEKGDMDIRKGLSLLGVNLPKEEAKEEKQEQVQEEVVDSATQPVNTAPTNIELGKEAISNDAGGGVL
jgi:hypothetical protein